MIGWISDALALARVSDPATRAYRVLGGTPVVIMDGLLPRDTAIQCYDEFTQLKPSDATRYADPDFEFGKSALNDWDRFPALLRELLLDLNSSRMLTALERITGIAGLQRDMGLWGGGLHITAPGGYLAIHRDFNVLPTTYRDPVQYRRVLNLIGYFNLGYGSDWGGELELWDSSGVSCERRIEPKHNRWVLFDTRGTYHGHPYPWHGSRPRYSVAVYYYVAEKVPMSEWTSTEYLRLPGHAETAEYAEKRRVRADARARYARWWPVETCRSCGGDPVANDGSICGGCDGECVVRI